MITFKKYLQRCPDLGFDSCWVYPTSTILVDYYGTKLPIVKAIFDYYGKEYDGIVYRICGTPKCINPKHLINSREHFWACVNVGDVDACWNWKTTLIDGDYGNSSHNGHPTPASRRAWILTYGEIESSDILVCHTCDNSACCNPRHLFLGTHQDNMTDKKLKGRAIIGEKGSRHKLTVEAVKEIRKQRTLGISYSKLADKFGVCQKNNSRCT